VRLGIVYDSWVVWVVPTKEDLRFRVHRFRANEPLDDEHDADQEDREQRGHHEEIHSG